MRIAFISADYSIGPDGRTRTPGGAGYYRCELPAAALNEFGGDDIEARVFTDAAARTTGEIVPIDEFRRPVDTGWDVIVMQRWMWPQIAEISDRARAAGQLVVQDVDDHFWSLHRANAASMSTDPTRSPDWNREHYTQSILSASLVTVSTPFLADVIRGLGQPNVAVLPNMIDLRNWKRQPVAEDVSLIGWNGSTAHRSNDLEQIGDDLRRYLKHHPNVRFRHGGHAADHPRAADALSIPHNRVDLLPLVPMTQYPMLWNGIDIALCPLNPIDFNRAKSCIKAMEASAAGVPFIATSLDAYVAFGAGVVVADRNWKRSLDMLTDDHELRTWIADIAHARVRREDVSLRWSDWSSAYEI